MVAANQYTGTRMKAHFSKLIVNKNILALIGSLGVMLREEYS
jgi:hypothetical protein